MINGDRLREIGYHDLERAEDEEALQGRATDAGGQRDRPDASRQGDAGRTGGGGARERQRESPRDWPTHLTERERREQWPIG